MAGNNQRSLRKTIIPAGEAQTLYSPELLALVIQNFRVTDEGTLRAVRGPTILEPDREQGYPLSGNPHGCYHGSLMGHDDTLLVRVGSKLYRQSGWNRGFEELESGLTDETEPRFPDQFIRFADRVIWTNGIDRPRVITFDGMVIPLGFERSPGAPVVQGPRNPGLTDLVDKYPNTDGYPWPGRIGTPGDTLSGQTGSILAGTWYFYEMLEDIHGNLSPASPASNAVSLRTMQADPYDAASSAYNEHGFEIDDLTKQFRVVSNGDEAPNHCVARRLYRTPDTRNAGNVPQLVARMANRRGLDYSCSISDSELGFPMDEIIGVPVFKVGCVHNGRLVIGNTTGDASIIRRSEPGYPGTFLSNEFSFPDDEGGEITGMASHGGRLIVFTESSVYDCTDFSNPVAIARGIGCAAPSSVRAHSSGLLIWLSRNGFYAMGPSGPPEPVSNQIQQLLNNRVNRGRLHMAVAGLDPESGEYICAVSKAGYPRNTLMLAFSGEGWRRYSLGTSCAGFAPTRDHRQYLLYLGQNDSDSQTHVYVFDRESVAYSPQKDLYTYQSALLMSDEVGLHPVEVHKLYIGMRDRWDGTLTLRAYKNGETEPRVSKTMRLLGTDDHDNQAGDNPSSQYRDVIGRAVIGTAKVHEPRYFWRKVDLNLKDVRNWRFEILANSINGTDIELCAFCFEISRVTHGNPLSRIPDAADA